MRNDRQMVCCNYRFLFPIIFFFGSFLQQLHWLHVQSCVLYKQCLLTYKVCRDKATKYISNLVSTVPAIATLPS